MEDIINTIKKFEIDELFTKTLAKPGIFAAHLIQNNNGKIEMRPYSSAKYLVKQLPSRHKTYPIRILFVL